MLKVESLGEAYYVDPVNQKMYSLGRPEDAFLVMREQGIGILNKDLEKIPVALVNSEGEDSDGDGLSDVFEEAIGFDVNNADTDGDEEDDKSELINTDDFDFSYANKQKGKIFLSVERNGEAWYVNPSDGMRYFLGRPADAFFVMRKLGLGISNTDFENLDY